MNDVEAIRKLNERELKLGLAGGPGSWHARYSHSAVVYVGGLPSGVTEGDVLTVFEQLGRVVHINMVRDEDTGKPRGFCFLGYQDQRSTILAVDNLNGADVYGSTLRVDHVDKYTPPDPGKVKLLDLSVDASGETGENGRGRGVNKRPADSAEPQVDEGARRRRVMERLSALRRVRAADEAAERAGRPPRPAVSQLGAPTERAGDVSHAGEAPADDVRRAEDERRARKQERRAQRRLVRGERERRREHKVQKRDRDR
jgi:RNA-binding motif protein, X-linked 2